MTLPRWICMAAVAVTLPIAAMAQGKIDLEMSPALIDARESWLNGRYDGIWEVVRSEAEAGHPVAQNILAVAMTDVSGGQGVPYDPEQGIAWFERAIEQDFVRAHYNLALFYSETHEGFAPDYTKSRDLADQAIALNYSHAHNVVGDLYFNGNGVEQSYSEALAWYRKGADMGAWESQRKIGDMYYFGHGVPINMRLAKSYFELAVSNGDRRAILDLAWMEEGNDGSEQDLTKAYLLYRLGVERGLPRAAYEMSGFLAYEDYVGFWQDPVETYGYCLLAMEWGHVLAEDDEDGPIEKVCAERAEGLDEAQKQAARDFAAALK